MAAAAARAAAGPNDGRDASLIDPVAEEGEEAEALAVGDDEAAEAVGDSSGRRQAGAFSQYTQEQQEEIHTAIVHVQVRACVQL